MIQCGHGVAADCGAVVGDFLIVGEGDGGEATTATGKKGAVTSIVVHILYKEQIKNLKQKGLWYDRVLVLDVSKRVWTLIA